MVCTGEAGAGVGVGVGKPKGNGEEDDDDMDMDDLFQGCVVHRRDCVCVWWFWSPRPCTSGLTQPFHVYTHACTSYGRRHTEQDLGEDDLDDDEEGDHLTGLPSASRELGHGGGVGIGNKGFQVRSCFVFGVYGFYVWVCVVLKCLCVRVSL